MLADVQIRASNRLPYGASQIGDGGVAGAVAGALEEVVSPAKDQRDHRADSSLLGSRSHEELRNEKIFSRKIADQGKEVFYGMGF